MKNLSSYPFSSWLRLTPLKFIWKHLRNKVVLNFYVQKKQNLLRDFLIKCQSLKDENIILVTAFEQPWVLEWLLYMSDKYVTDATILVFDNSKDLKARKEIQKVCERNNTLYLPLPKNPTTHVNRSHALAMQWVYDNVVKYIKPYSFTFIDHDMIPIKKLSISKILGSQDFYGLLKDKSRSDPGSWSIWAGYTLFRYNATKNIKMNFMYDFSRDLDTGGGNYESLYKFYDRKILNFSSKDRVSLEIPKVGIFDNLQLLDGCWHHIGSVSYNNNFLSRKDYCLALSEAIHKGLEWDDLLMSNK
jgi:hypothetical protein